MVVGVAAELLLISSCPSASPVDVGSNDRLTVSDAPAARVTGTLVPPMTENGDPETVNCEIATAVLP